MPQQVTKAQLTPSQRCLVEWMQRMYFGRIEGLRVQVGEPVCDPPPRCIREIKLGKEAVSHPLIECEDFALREEVLDLLAQMKRIDDGVIQLVEVRHGLPVRMVLEEEVTMAQTASD